MSGRIRAVLTDVEGTTSSTALVTETLFPYARKRMAAFVEANPERVAPLLAEVTAQERGDPVATLLRWMDEDRKATPLKALQGMIWSEGYARGELEGHVYPDAAEALRRWRADGLALYVYSSGSVEAQKLIFGRSNEGDLTPLFSGYFDTTIGAKKDADSYKRIAAKIALNPREVMFLSDNMQEIDAARAADMEACHIDRAGPGGDVESFAAIRL